MGLTPIGKSFSAVTGFTGLLSRPLHVTLVVRHTATPAPPLWLLLRVLELLSWEERRKTSVMWAFCLAPGPPSSPVFSRSWPCDPGQSAESLLCRSTPWHSSLPSPQDHTVGGAQALGPPHCPETTGRALPGAAQPLLVEVSAGQLPHW